MKYYVGKRNSKASDTRMVDNIDRRTSDKLASCFYSLVFALTNKNDRERLLDPDLIAEMLSQEGGEQKEKSK